MHNARKVRKIRTLGECLLKVKGVKLKRQNDTRHSDDENKDEGLYNEIKAWKPRHQDHKHEQSTCNCSYSLKNKTRPVNSFESN